MKVWRLVLIVLVSVDALLLWQLVTTWRQHQTRLDELQALLAIKPEQQAASLPEPPAPVVAAAYVNIATKFLFAPDRTPDVIVEVVRQEEPMPDLPEVHGVVNLGTGPLILVSERPGAAHQAYGVGDRVSGFTIVAIQPDSVTFQWRDQKVTVPLVELVARAAARKQQQAAQESNRAPAARKEVQVSTAGRGKPELGPDIGGGIRACVPGDPTPPGTVVEGYKKMVTATPFGQTCRWEPVQ